MGLENQQKKVISHRFFWAADKKQTKANSLLLFSQKCEINFNTVADFFTWLEDFFCVCCQVETKIPANNKKTKIRV